MSLIQRAPMRDGGRDDLERTDRPAERIDAEPVRAPDVAGGRMDAEVQKRDLSLRVSRLHALSGGGFAVARNTRTVP